MPFPWKCERCGSVGSVEFDMCQVCYRDYSRDETVSEERIRRRLRAVGGRDRDFPSGGWPRRTAEESLAGGVKA